MRRAALLWLAIAAGACARGPAVVTILHLNDVYEISPVEGGRAGGLARVATVVAEYRRTHSPLVATLGGDYLSPSAIGTARVDGQPLAGRQMVDVLNGVGVEWVTFGNHEFDVSEAAFRSRLSEGKFHLVSSNVSDANGQPFPGVPRSTVVTVSAGGRAIRLGLIGVTIAANKKPWVKYEDGIGAATREVAALRGQTDAIVALTHLSLADDAQLVSTVQGINVVLGGHEHENWMMRRGPAFTPVIKADANVRSVAIVTLSFANAGARPQVDAHLVTIDDHVAPDPAVDATVKKWTTTAFDAFKRDGFNPDNVVATIPRPLDGRESTVRNSPGELTAIIAASMLREVKMADVAIFNGGSVRIDDVVPAGPIREYDIIRILPFGGKVLQATFDGSLLAQVLDLGVNNEGTGGYLQTAGVKRENNQWVIGGQPLNSSRKYVVAINDFLLSGGETNLGFLTRTNPHVHDVKEFRDIRQAVIEELKGRRP